MERWNGSSIVIGMKESKPIPLWKSIVGVSVSSSAIIISAFLLVIRLLLDITQMELGVYPAILVWSVPCLIINLRFLRSTIRYRRTALLDKAISLSEGKARSLNGNSALEEEKTKLLHRLLEEGKITIEEYDQLKGI